MRGARLHGRRGWRRGRVVWLGGVGVCSAAFYPPKCPPTSFSTTVHSSSSTFFCRFPRPYNDVVTLLYQLLVPLFQLYYCSSAYRFLYLLYRNDYVYDVSENQGQINICLGTCVDSIKDAAAATAMSHTLLLDKYRNKYR